MGKGEETRLRIITSAIQLFNTEGINWTSFQMLAKKVGISQPAIYIYFADKDDLILACCEEIVMRGRKFIDNLVNQNANAKDRLASYIGGNIKWALAKPKEVDLLVIMYSSGSFNSKYKDLHGVIDKGAIQRIASHLIQAQYEKQHSSKTKSADKLKKIESNARLIHSLIVGEMIKALRWPEELNVNTRINLILDFVDSIT